MRCKQCEKRYALDRMQPSPGGSSSPGYFFWPGVALLAVSLVVYRLKLSPWHWGALAVGVLFLVKVPIAYSDCTGGDDPGSVCPNCRSVNRAYWWSI